MNPQLLTHMSWPEVRDALAEIEIALLPIGSLEQHGPNLGQGTDSASAFGLAQKLGGRLGTRALVLPPVNYGISFHHMRFPGTVSLQPETLIAIVLDIARSLKQHGIEKMLIVNGHGGNKSALGVVVTKLRFQEGMQAAIVGCGLELAGDYLTEAGISEVRGHSCEAEVSQVMVLAPELVKRDHLAAGEIKDPEFREWRRWGDMPQSFDEITANGALGDATRATVEMGQRMVAIALDRIEGFVRTRMLGE